MKLIDVFLNHSETITPINYQVDLENGGDPDPFFTDMPSLEDLATAIDEATNGELGVCTQDCVPYECNLYTLEVCTLNV